MKTQTHRGITVRAYHIDGYSRHRAGPGYIFEIDGEECAGRFFETEQEALDAGLAQVPHYISPYDAASEAAKLLGAKGGKSTSDAKQAAVRENGKKGGRPKLIVKDLHDICPDEIAAKRAKKS